MFNAYQTGYNLGYRIASRLLRPWHDALDRKVERARNEAYQQGLAEAIEQNRRRRLRRSRQRRLRTRRKDAV